MELDDDLAAWIAGLDDLFASTAGRFSRVEPRLRARAHVPGLPAPLAAKNGWTRAEAAGIAMPDGMQRLLKRAAWDDDGLRDNVRAYVARHLGSSDRVVVVDLCRCRRSANSLGGRSRNSAPGPWFRWCSCWPPVVNLVGSSVAPGTGHRACRALGGAGWGLPAFPA
jgi:hypothetical protein